MLNYAFEISTLVAIFVVASLGLAVIVNLAGLLSMAHGASVGLGAYTFALLTTQHGWSIGAALAAATVLPGAFGAALAYFGSELDEEQFAVTTLAFNILIISVITNWTSLTNGSYGISRIPAVMLFGIDSRLELMIICLLAAVVMYFLLSRLANSSFGVLLRASASERQMIEALGTNVVGLRVKAVTLGCAIGGVAGALLSMHTSYIAPEEFELHLSILLLAMVVIGANRSMAGAAVGAALLVLVPELLRFGVSSAAAAGPIRQVVFGTVLLAVIFLQARQATTASFTAE
jgi:branched-chain amino acid transport system permease protein